MGNITVDTGRTRAGRHFTGRLGAIVATALSLVVAAPGIAFAAYSSTPDNTARVNNTVLAIAQVGSRTIIGGNFTSVGGQPRNGVAAIRADGTVDPTFNPDVDGVVRAISASEDGSRIFLGGTFADVGGQPRANLAAVDATGTVLPDWSANTGGTRPDVLSLAVSGSRLYAGGRYTTIDGRTNRKRLTALDVTTGDVDTSFAPFPNSWVRVVVPNPDGSSVFAAGAFTTIGGASRPTRVAELDTQGAATAFAPTSGGGGVVVAMGTSPSTDRLYYGIGDNRVFAYDVASNTEVWTVKNGGDTQAIDATEDEVFLGGHFGNNLVDKVKRQWVESVNASDGSVTSWDAGLSGGTLGVWAIQVTPAAVLVGGEFTTSHGAACRRFARFAVTP